MTENEVIAVASDAVWTAVRVGAPILIVALVVGLAIAIFQAVTQIQEQTLVFVPKIIAIVAAVVVTGPWMMNVMVGFTRTLFESIPQITGN